MDNRRNNVLVEVIIGIMIYGFFAELIGVFFVNDKIYYTLGLAIGLFISIASIIHMNSSVQESVELAESEAVKKTHKSQAVRFICSAIILGAAIYMNIGSVIAMIIGIAGLKVAAYIQPITHRYISTKIFK